MNDDPVGHARGSAVTLARLDESSMRAVVKRARRLEYAPDQVLFREGEAGNSLFLVLEGRVRVFRGHGDAEVQLTEAGPGDIMGEMAPLDPGPRSASAVSVDGGASLRLSNDDLEDLLWEDPGTGQALLKVLLRVLAARVRHVDEAIGELVAEAEQKGASTEDEARGIWRLLWMGP
jgi:CRP-like cAMP-binding protein